jgi:hypothetical protein
MYGEWRTSPAQYVSEVRRYQSEIGKMLWAAQQDWMCEPAILHKTGFTVVEHQTFTVCNFLSLQMRAPDLPWVPVIQGFRIEDYHRHVEMFAKAGVDLWKYARVGIGSICRRQASSEIAKIVRSVSALGINLHTFGVKEGGLKSFVREVTSSDSMAWSATARRSRIRLLGCTHRNCANCILFALQWRQQLLDNTGAR